ncbi:MAG TPA: hypothetical protein ACYCC0_00845 [Candidatus Azoamicus sp.]
MKLNLLCLELAYNFCSISLKKNNEFYYKEYTNTTQTIKTIIQVIDLILIEGNLSYKEIDFIVFGEYPNNLINLKALTIIAKSLSLSWKIPILKFNSLLTISFEAFFLYKNNYILTLVETNKNTLIYSKCIFKEKKLTNYYIKEITSIDEMKYKELDNFMFIINCSTNTLNFIKSNYKFMKIKENILPKAIYTSLFFEKFIFLKNELCHDKIKLYNSKKNSFTKYKYQ